MSTEIEKVDSSVTDIKEQMVKKELLNESSIKNETNDTKDEKADLKKKEGETEDNNKDCNDHTAEINNKKEDLETKENKKSNDEVSVKEINDQDSKAQKEKDKDVGDKDATNKKSSDIEASDKEASDKEASDKEASDKEASDKEASDKEDSDSDEGNTSQAKESDEAMSTDKPASTPTCRARKKVERFSVGFSVTKEKIKILEGSGQKLGECPAIESQVTKHNIIDLKLLHKILYNRPGSVHEIKRNIRKFSGFCFKKESNEYEQKKTLLERYKAADLKKICEILTLERSGTREDLSMRVLTFLMEPKDSGKLPKKKGSSHNKKKKTEKSPKTTKKSLKNDEVYDVNMSSDEASNVKDENASEDDKSEEESEHEKKKLNSSKGKKTPAKTKPVKKEKVKKEPAKGTKRKKEVQADSSDEDEEPLQKKSKTPSDNEIKKLVKQILEKADLQEITMKKVIKQVYDTYPDCDLTSKKSFIKTTIKSVIVSL